MSTHPGFEIDPTATFPHLPRAPIVEAVIHWQTYPAVRLEKVPLERALRGRFDGYSMREQHGLETALSGSTEGVELHHRSSWDGFRLASADGKHLCQFKPDAVVFSRLAPYEGWPPFIAEAWRFWDQHAELARPLSIKRVGVRFISMIKLKEGEPASAYLVEAPAPLDPIGLESDSFFHKDTFRPAGQPYQIDLVRALQGPSADPSAKRQLIVDIDVSTTGIVGVDRAEIEVRLSAMRYIKNKVFFSCMKDAENRFGGSQP